MAKKNAARGGCRLRFGQLLLLRTPLSKRASWRAALCRTGAAAAAYTPQKGALAICIPGSKTENRTLTAAAGSNPANGTFVQTTTDQRFHRTKRWAKRSQQPPRAHPAFFWVRHLYKTVFSFFAVHGGCRLHSGQSALRWNHIFRRLHSTKSWAKRSRQRPQTATPSRILHELPKKLCFPRGALLRCFVRPNACRRSAEPPYCNGVTGPHRAPVGTGTRCVAATN